MAAGWAVWAVLAGVVGAMAAPAQAQEQDQLFLPPLWDDDSLLDMADERLKGDERDAETAAWPMVPGAAGTDDVVPLGAGDHGLEGAVQERPERQPQAAQDAGMGGELGEQPGTAKETGSSSLLGYLGERKEALRPPAPGPGLSGAAAALFGCPRSVLEDLLKAATAKADVVSSLEIEREVLTFCAERQALVVQILQAEAELERLWRESLGPAPEARQEPVDVLAQLTEFQGAAIVDFAEEALEPEPEPEPESAPPAYGWFSIFGTAGDLQAGVSDGGEVWFVRERDALPGGVVVERIGVRPPGVHVLLGSEELALPYRPADGEDG